MSEFDNGDGTFDRFMTADMSIVAEGARYESLILYARLMVMVWTIGESRAGRGLLSVVYQL